MLCIEWYFSGRMKLCWAASFCISVWTATACDCWLMEQINEQILHPFNDLFSRTTWVSHYQKGKTSLDLNDARGFGMQWHQLGHMQTICTSLQTDNHSNSSSLNFLQAGCSSWRPTNSVKALKAVNTDHNSRYFSQVQCTQFHCPMHKGITQQYTGWTDILWVNMALRVQLRGKDLLFFSKNIEPGGLRKCPNDD